MFNLCIKCWFVPKYVQCLFDFKRKPRGCLINDGKIVMGACRGNCQNMSVKLRSVVFFLKLISSCFYPDLCNTFKLFGSVVILRTDKCTVNSCFILTIPVTCIECMLLIIAYIGPFIHFCFLERVVRQNRRM